MSRLWLKKGSKGNTIIQRVTYFTESSQSNSSWTGAQEVSSSVPLLKPESAIRLHEATQGFVGADHRTIKAPPLCQAPHHNCSSLPTSVFYLQAQNQEQYSWCGLGTPVQGSSCFTWPGALLLLMQPQTASAVCFEGMLPACGQFTCRELWEIPVKTQGKKVLQTWAAWVILICVHCHSICPVQQQASIFLAYSFTAHPVAEDCLAVLNEPFPFQLQVSLAFPNTITVCHGNNSESLLCSLLLLPPPQYCPLKMKLSSDLPTFFAEQQAECLKEGRRVSAWRTCQVTWNPLKILSSIISWLIQSLISPPCSTCSWATDQENITPSWPISLSVNKKK